MAYRTYVPERGDIVHLNFSPSAGHEMAGPHYALVLSPDLYNRKSEMCLLVPITNRIRGGPFEVPLPKGILPPKSDTGEVDSVILSDAVRQVDYRERSATKVGSCPRATIDAVIEQTLAILDPQA
jgi:mRNA interferase MazF